METSIPGLSSSEARYVLQARARLGRPFTSLDMDDVELDGIAMAVLDADPGDEEITLIGLDREERGYLTVGNVAAILNWIVAQAHEPLPPAPPPVRCGGCHRLLTDAVSRRRGYGPACWAKTGGDDRRRHDTGGPSIIQLALPLATPAPLARITGPGWPVESVVELVEVRVLPAGSATTRYGERWWVMVIPIVPTSVAPACPAPRGVARARRPRITTGRVARHIVH